MIEHEVELVRIDKEASSVVYSLKTTEACGACAAKNMCSMGMAKEKIYTKKVEDIEKYAIGDKAVLQIEERVAIKAVFFAYIIPIILLMLGLFWGLYLFDSEALIAVFAIGLPAVYVAIIKIFGISFKNTIKYRIEEL